MEFDPEIGAWHWNIHTINALGKTEDDSAFLRTKISGLPDTTQVLLQCAACFGARFPLAPLALALGRDPERIGEILIPGITVGVVEPQLNMPLYASTTRKGAGREEFFSFSHDRVRQVIYESLPEPHRSEMHWKLGSALLEESDDNASKISFEAVNQLNLGRRQATVPAELEKLIERNISAGMRAQKESAFGSALGYFRTAGEILLLRHEVPWNTGRAKIRQLSLLTAEAAYLSGNFDEVDNQFGILERHSIKSLEMAEIYEIKIKSQMAQDRKKEAVDTAIAALAKLGMRFPKKPNKVHALLAILAAKHILSRKTTDELEIRGEISDPVLLSMMSILENSSAAAYLARPDIWPLFTIKMFSLTLRYGNSLYSSISFLTFAIVLIGLFSQVDRAHELGKLALLLQAKKDDGRLKARVHFIVYCFIFPYKFHLSESVQYLKEGRSSAVETGYWEVAGYLANFIVMNSFHSGSELEGLRNTTLELRKESVLMKQTFSVGVLEIWLTAMDRLCGGAEEARRPQEGEFREFKPEVSAELEANPNFVFMKLLSTVIVDRLLGNASAALEASTKARKLLPTQFGLYLSAIFLFHESLILAENTGLNRFQSFARLGRMRSNMKKLKALSKKAPANFAHKYLLVEAEIHRLCSRPADAYRSYESAIRLARANKYVGEEGMALELAARCHIGQGSIRLGRYCLRDANLAYLKWGAVSKAEQMNAQFAPIISGFGERPIGNHSKSESGLPWGRTDASLIKASQAISQEILFSKLLEALMTIVLEYGGAGKAALVLVRRNGKYFVEAEATSYSKGVAFPLVSLTEHQELPIALILQCLSSGSVVALANASHDPAFFRDPYVRRTQPKSVLCMPLIHQGRVMGVLYLENNLVTGAFTIPLLETLNLICCQAAISLTNTQYHELQLEAVQSKVNPHFLFNVLSSIANLVATNPPAAESAIVQLSTLYRYVLTSTEVKQVSLEQELNMVQMYLNLEKLRFGDRLTYQVVSEGDISSVRLPGLLIQPLVENSIRHGIAPKMGPGSILVIAIVKGDSCHIEVSDDGDGSDESTKGTGFGLKSVQERLKLTYGAAYTLGIKSSPGYCVEITFPVKGQV